MKTGRRATDEVRRRPDNGRLATFAPARPGGPLTPTLVHDLQPAAGNTAVCRLVAQRQVQAPPQLSSYARATDTLSYIVLVRELEKQFPDKNSLEVLAMLRQAYYGKPWSVDKAPQWSDVIPVGGNPGNPADRIGSGPGSLFAALQASQEVAGTDMGHIFAGLQAFFHRTPDVSVTSESGLILRTIGMPNTEFATWGGDIGAAAARPLINAALGRPVPSDADSFRADAPDQDLEGNLDAYAMVKGAGGAKSLESMLQVPGISAPGTPVSQVLYEYFLGSSRLAGARATKYKDFLTAIGGAVSGQTITNRAALEGALTPRVADFAAAYFWGRYAAKEGKAAAAAKYLVDEGDIRAKAFQKARVMVGMFLDWIQARL